MIKRLDINGNPYVGIFCSSTERITIVPPTLTARTMQLIRSCLGTHVIQMTIGGSTILGALTAMNSHGAIITDFVDDEELEPLKAQIENVCRIPDKLNAAGNNILVNDHGALVHPELSKEAINAIEDTLNVEVLKGTIAGLKNVGALAVATNKGVLCHPKTTRAELKKLKELFKVHVDIGTANYGTPLIGACIIANTKGVITGPPTTGIELGRIEDTLGYI